MKFFKQYYFYQLCRYEYEFKTKLWKNNVEVLNIKLKYFPTNVGSVEYSNDSCYKFSFFRHFICNNLNSLNNISRFHLLCSNFFLFIDIYGLDVDNIMDHTKTKIVIHCHILINILSEKTKIYIKLF